MNLDFLGYLVRVDAKPCPFCGGRDLYVHDRAFFDGIIAEHGSAKIDIECSDCHCELSDYGDDTDYDARLARIIRRWNDRPVWNKYDGGYEK